jgi:hypothetical protein
MRRRLALCALLLAATPGRTFAALATVEFGGGYRVRVTDTITKSLDAMTMGGMGSQANYAVDAEAQRAAARARKIPAQRREATIAAQREIEACHDAALAEARKAMIE